MRPTVRTVAACVSILALLFVVSPAAAIAATASAAGRLEGLVVNVDGRPADGYRIHLIDSRGEALPAATADPDGTYSFPVVAPGEYALGIESPDGVISPVAAPPVRLAEGELVRRDLKMVEADPATVGEAAQANYGFGLWWAGLGIGAKVGIIIAIVAAAYGVAEAVDDDDPAARCGDGRVDSGEQCDDGNTTNGDGCSSLCQNEASPF